MATDLATRTTHGGSGTESQPSLPKVRQLPCPAQPKLIGELLPAAWHHNEQYGNNRIEADHGQLKRRLRPMRHLRNDRTATVIIQGQAFIQNLHRDHYQLTAAVPTRLRLAEAFDELSHAI